MNRIRIIGLLLLIAGISAHFFLEGDQYDMLSGLLMGLGIGLLITGRFRRTQA
jgi:uncharacterized membrane-anchored protein